MEDVALKIINKLKAEGFVIQRYDSKSTDSIYLKLDYGVCNSIRISDHLSKDHLQYKYNVMKDRHKIKRSTYNAPGKYPRWFYGFEHVDELVVDIVMAKKMKISRYGGQSRYNYFMNKNKFDNRNNQGFWANCWEV